MNLKEFAAAIGVSPTTASRALGGYPEVSEATRARVVAAAARHGYRPNTRARGLATGRAMTIGHVVPRAASEELLNPIFTESIAGASEAYGAAGYALRLSVVPDADEARTYRELAADGSVDGVMLHAPRVGDARLALLDEIGLPFLVHGRVPGARRPYAWLDVDNARAFEEGAGLLLELGHRRIALVNGRESQDFAIRRRRGYEAALAAGGARCDPALVAAGDMTEAAGYRAARAMFGRPDPPTAFLVSSMISAIGVRRAIAEADLRMGEDASVVVFDDVLSYLGNDGPDETPLFTALRSSVREGGRLAAGMLIAHVAARAADPAAPPPTRLLEAEIIRGRSTGPAPERMSSRHARA